VWVSEFGFKDRKFFNVNIRISLWDGEAVRVVVDGYEEKQFNDKSLSRKRLAAKPLKLITQSGRHLSISYNLKTAQLTLKHNGDDVESLPQVVKVLQICRNKIKHSKTSDQRMTQFYTIYDDVLHVISVTYFKKRKYLEVRLNKAK